MSRKDFELIAKILKSSKPESHWDANKMAQWEVTVNRFAVALNETNSSFNQAKFLQAAGV